MTTPILKIPSLAAMNAVIETARIRLRPFRATDVDDIWPIVSDPEFPRMMSWEAHRERAETVAWVERHNAGIANNTDMTWAIEYERRAVGCIGLHGIQWEMRAWRVDRGAAGQASHLQPACGQAHQGERTEFSVRPGQRLLEVSRSASALLMPARAACGPFTQALPT